MSLQPCQLDAYVAHGWSRVLSCTPSTDGRFDVVVDQSVLYPEGGGQPADHGRIRDVPVVDVQTDGEGRVHLTTTAAVALGEARVHADLVRRFDHMQQHTAQHLITAVAQDRFGRATTSFHLGATESSIDLDGPLSAAQVQALEDAVNAEIRLNRPVEHRVVDLATYRALDVRSRGLPAGYEGDVRLVEIAGIDVNTCGGTHVSQLGELQLVHLIGTEKVRGGARLSFVAGHRVVRRLREATHRTGALNRALKCGPDAHLDSVKRLLDDAKSAGRQRRHLLGELAAALGATIPGADPTRPVHIHREAPDLGFLRSIADAARSAGHTGPILLTGGQGAGVFLLDASAERVQQVGPAIANALDGRGGGRGTRFQGKAADLSAACVGLLDYSEA